MRYTPRRWAGPTYRKPRRRPRCPSAIDHVICQRWSQRNPGAPCALPDNLLWQFAGGHRGVVRVALSPSERILAVVPGWEQYLRASHLRPRRGPSARHLRGRARRVRPPLARVRAQRWSRPGDQLRVEGWWSSSSCPKMPLASASRRHFTRAPACPATSTLTGNGRVRWGLRERLMRHRVCGTKSLFLFL